MAYQKIIMKESVSTVQYVPKENEVVTDEVNLKIPTYSWTPFQLYEVDVDLAKHFIKDTKWAVDFLTEIENPTLGVRTNLNVIKVESPAVATAEVVAEVISLNK